MIIAIHQPIFFLFNIKSPEKIKVKKIKNTTMPGMRNPRFPELNKPKPLKYIKKKSPTGKSRSIEIISCSLIAIFIFIGKTFCSIILFCSMFLLVNYYYPILPKNPCPSEAPKREKEGLANALPVRSLDEEGMRSPVVTELVEVYYLGFEPVLMRNIYKTDFNNIVSIKIPCTIKTERP